MTVQLDIAIDDLDDEKWQIVEASMLDLEDITITTTSSWLNYLINLMHGELVKIIKSNLPKGEAAIDKLFTDFNEMLAYHNDTTFMYHVADSTYINLTTTKAPTLLSDSGLLTLNLDGLFYDMEARSSHVPQTNSVQTPRLHQSHTEQFWMHESFMNSFYMSYMQGKISVDLNNANVTKYVEMFLPEIRGFYGNDAKLDLQGNILSLSSNAFTLDSSKGMIIGDGETALFKMSIFAQNNSMTEKELAAEFDMYMSLTTNITVQNFYVYTQFPSFTVHGANVTADNCHLYDRDYSKLIQDLLHIALNVVNDVLSEPYDLRKLNPNIGFIAGMFQNLTVTPFQEDEFYYAGFKFFTDRPS